MKEFFKDWNPSRESEVLVVHAGAIIEEYSDDGYTLTLRQLYYQFVARGLIENTERSYKNLGAIITRARMAGLISWTAIEDRNREHHSPYVEEDPTDALRNLPDLIQFDQWERQSHYVEVWVEKEALGNVIERACYPLRLPYMACKGYLSASEAWRAGKRFETALDAGKECVLIHLGDHDPSGLDMTRDNNDRLDILSNCPGEVQVSRIALNMDQVDQYDPPPNPAKLSDSRAKDYIARYGSTSWELDALEPKVMLKLIKDEVEQYIDREVWEAVQAEQTEVKEALETLGDNWDDVKEFLANL